MTRTPDPDSSRPASPTVAVPQTDVVDLDPDANLARVRERVGALPDRVDVAAFPEYGLTGFVADDRVRDAALAREDAVDRLAGIAADADVALVAGYLEDAGDALYNATAYVPPGGVGGAGRDDPSDAVDRATVYRKRHLWGSEAGLVEPGTERVVVDTPAGSTGLLTCYDLNFVAESAWFAERAVDALFVPGAWPAAHSENWRLLLRARALDGVRWVVGAGRTGERDVDGASTATYAGSSLVARPDGRVGAALGRGERDLIVDLDREVLAEQRELVGSVGTDI